MKRPQLLLIDDEPALADFVANAARECGFDPTVTSNDMAFRDEFRAGRPDAVAMDLGMPVDGVELLRFLSDELFEGPVLIISGSMRKWPRRVSGVRISHDRSVRPPSEIARPGSPAGSDVGLTVSGALTTTEYACDAVAPTVSVAVIVKLNVPAADDVPLIAPLTTFNVNPVGSVPADTL